METHYVKVEIVKTEFCFQNTINHLPFDQMFSIELQINKENLN